MKKKKGRPSSRTTHAQPGRGVYRPFRGKLTGSCILRPDNGGAGIQDYQVSVRHFGPAVLSKYPPLRGSQATVERLVPPALISRGSDSLQWAGGQRGPASSEKGCAPKRGSESPLRPAPSDPTAGEKKQPHCKPAARTQGGKEREQAPGPGRACAVARGCGGDAASRRIRDWEFSHVRSGASPTFPEAKLLFPQTG